MACGLVLRRFSNFLHLQEVLLLDKRRQGTFGNMVWLCTVRRLLLLLGLLLLLLDCTGSLVSLLGEELGQLMSIRWPSGLDHDLVPSSMLQWSLLVLVLEHVCHDLLPVLAHGSRGGSCG